MSTGGPIRVLIADDDRMVREGLKVLIGRRDDMAVVAEAASGRKALAEAKRHKPDVALVDLHMSELNGSDLVAALVHEAPQTRVVVISAFGREQDIASALRAGAKAYLSKATSREDLFACIRAVHAGTDAPVAGKGRSGGAVAAWKPD